MPGFCAASRKVLHLLKRKPKSMRQMDQEFLLEKYPEALPFEDRTFGGCGLYIETVPTGAWFKNLRSMMAATKWQKLSKYVRQRAGNKCEICGSDQRLEAHERWVFHEASKTQQLVRLVCVCKNCHLGIHWGLTCHIGLDEQIRKHILAVTGWTDSEFKENRSRRPSADFSEDWSIDISIVEAAGISMCDPASNIGIKRRAMAATALKNSIERGIDGGRMDLSRERSAGFVVFLSRNDKDFVGSSSVSECGWYLAKDSGKLGKRYVTIPIAKYIEACKNSIKVKRERDLDGLLVDLKTL